jgi:hypothetical protein
VKIIKMDGKISSIRLRWMGVHKYCVKISRAEAEGYFGQFGWGVGHIVLQPRYHGSHRATGQMAHVQVSQHLILHEWLG